MENLQDPSLDCCIIIFVKVPSPGQVKTRLGQDIGHDQATLLYRCFAEDVLATVDTLGVESLIFFAPEDGLSELKQWLGPHRAYIPQQGSHLGDRMAHAFRSSFALGYQQVLILGSDSPDLPPTYLTEAITALHHNKIVIGPSTDGGYYTLGFTPTTFCPAIFEITSWSTPNVYSQTLTTLKQNPHTIQVLQPWSDIDTLNDLWQFYQRHQALSCPTPLSNHTLAYIHEQAGSLFQSYGA